MAIRTLAQLAVDQERILDQYRERAAEGAAPDDVPREPLPTVGMVGAHGLHVLARVDQVVTGDPQFGAHLEVVVQQFSGVPPVATDGLVPVQRAYPTPNSAVTDYAVNELVALWLTPGALLAAKLT